MQLPAFYKYAVLVMGLSVALGNFLPGVPTWGFDHYVLGMPFGSKSLVSFIIIMAIATYPFLCGKSKLYDILYVVVATLSLVFSLVVAAIALADIYVGLDPVLMYRSVLGEDYRGSGIFFFYESRAVFLFIVFVYLLWSLRLASFSTRDIILVAYITFLSVGITMWQLWPQEF